MVPSVKLLMAFAKEMVSVRVRFLAFDLLATPGRMHEADFGERGYASSYHVHVVNLQCRECPQSRGLHRQDGPV